MSFEPTKVIEMDQGKQIGSTMIETAENIPYGSTTVGAELARLNSNLTALHDLIWTNPAPTSDFAGQTINVDLSAYDHIFVSAKDGCGFVRICGDLFDLKGSNPADPNGEGGICAGPHCGPFSPAPAKGSPDLLLIGAFKSHFMFQKRYCLLAVPFLKRRRRDLNPRAALTTYTLSRGASSAS